MYIHSRMIRPAVLSHWLRGEKKRHDCSHVATCNLVILVTKQQTIGTHTFQWQSCRFTIYSFRDFWTLYTWIDHPTHAVLVRLSERISVNFMEAKEKVNTDLRILQIWQALRVILGVRNVQCETNGTAWHSPKRLKNSSMLPLVRWEAQGFRANGWGLIENDSPGGPGLEIWVTFNPHWFVDTSATWARDLLGICLVIFLEGVPNFTKLYYIFIIYQNCISNSPT